MVLDCEARLSQSGVPSGLESSVSLAVLSVITRKSRGRRRWAGLEKANSTQEGETT